MTQSKPLNTEETPELKAKLVRDATFAAILLIAAGLALFAYAISIVSFTDWEDYILVGFPLVLAGASLASIFIMRRGNLALGSGIIFSLNLLVPLILAFTVRDTLWTASAYAFVSSALLIWRAIPRRSWRWTIIVAAVVLIVVVVVNLINPAGRFLPPDGFDVFISVLLSILFVAFFAQAARQAWGGNIRVKIITGFTVVALTSLGILGTVTYINYRNQIREDIRQRLLNIISITALQQDGDLHSTIKAVPEENQGAAYKQMVARNEAILKTDPDLEYIYSMRLNEQGQIYFVLDASLDPTYEYVEVGKIYDDPSDLLAENIATLDHPIVEENFYTDIYGTFLSAYAPIYRSDGTRDGVIGVDIVADKIIVQERQVFFLIFGTTLVAMVLVTILGLFLGNLFTNPIIHLSQIAQKVTEGDLNTRAEVETTDEIGDLAKAFNAMTSRLQGTLQGLEQRVAARTRNLELAAEVGRAVSEVRDLDVMLKDACELILKEFNLYYVQVYLTDPSGSTLKLEAGTGSVGEQLLGRGHSLPLDPGSINGRAAVEKRSVVISDTAKSATFRRNALLPETRGEMAVPLIVANKAVGVLDMQSSEPGVLTEEVLPAFEALAGQMAVAVQNANLLAETEQARIEVEKQARRLVREGWDEHLDAIHKPEQLGYVFAKNTVTPLDAADEMPATEMGKAVSVPISVTGEALGSLVVELDNAARAEQTKELVNIVARQVAQQIENLRLLESAERYRTESERAARLQTIEGWQKYLQARSAGSLGYLYDTKEVRPKDGKDEDASMFALPLKAREEMIGKLSVAGLTDGDQESVDLVNAVAERLSAHIENLRLFEETRQGQLELDKRARQLAAVAEISTASSQELETDKLLNTVVRLTQRQFGLYHAHIFTFNENTQSLDIVACGWEEGSEHEGTHETNSIPLDRERSLVARAARTGRAVIANDVKSESGWLPNPLLPDTASEMAVPLIVGDRVLGVLDVQADRVNAFTDEDANIQTTLASQVATALQNARSFTQAQKQAEREAMLNVINQKIQGATSVEAVLQIAARELGTALGAPMTVAQLSMKDKEKSS